MKQSNLQLDYIFHQVDRYVRNRMSNKEEALFLKKIKNDKHLCNMVFYICSFIKQVKHLSKE